MRSLLTAAIIGAATLIVPLSAWAAPPSSQTVIFGHESTGSEQACGPHDTTPAEPPLNRCPPDRAVGQSAEAADVLVPRTVVVSAGGSVTFDNSGAPHRVGVCAEGITPDEVILPTSGNVITDSQCVHGANGEDVTATFAQPGKYLIICGFAPHFVDREMYGWVVVQ